MAFKSLLRSPVLRAAACWLAAQYIRFVWLTGRWRVDGANHPEKLLAEGRPFVVAFWHGRLLMLPKAWPYPARFQMVISQHADGELISRTVGILGIGTLAGSTSRGAASVLRGMVRTLLDGGCVGITPDGPRGPRMRATPGAVQAARLAGAPILPLAYACRPIRLAGSWDRMLIPLPFGRGIVRWGEPLDIPRDADVDAETRKLEDRLNALAAALDDELGLPQIKPGAPDMAKGRA
jgi:lysophospholipid acyltransferase (LPLAT)-like uncharacterized protein